MAKATKAKRDSMHQVWTAYKGNQSNDRLRNVLVEKYLPLVKYHAQRIFSRMPNGVELDDLISAGVFGLVEAIAAYDLSRGVKFETYCAPRIRAAMLDELRMMDWAPRTVRSTARKLGDAVEAFETRYGRPPTEEEVATHLGISLAKLKKMIAEAKVVNVLSMNRVSVETDRESEVRTIDILEDKKSEDPTRRVQKKDLMRLVTKGLNRNERLIIILYYYEGLTMKEIGKTLKLSESRVSQIRTSILDRLTSQLGTQHAEFSAVCA